MREAKVQGLAQRPVIRDTGACLLRAQTRQKPDRTRTDRCKPPALALHPCRTCLAQRRTVGNMTRSTPPQLHAICAICAIWPPTRSPPGPCYMYYMCYILQGKPLNIHSLPGPCYMCYMCYISQGKPLNIHSPPGPCYMCYMCYMAPI